MPRAVAMDVVKGRMTEADALERLARRAEVDLLMHKHGLDRALATQVVVGDAALDAVLATRRFEAHRAAHRGWSVLADAQTDEVPRWFLGVDGGSRVARVAVVDTYTVTLVDRRGETTSLHKLALALAADAAVERRVRRALRRDPEIAAQALAPSTRPQDRYGVSDRRLFRLMDGGEDALVTLVSGDRLRGGIAWFARYEFGLRLKGDVEVVVFRHALHQVTGARPRPAGRD